MRRQLPTGTTFNLVVLIVAMSLFLGGLSCSRAKEEDKSITRSPVADQPASPEIGVGDLYAVVVGVSKYANPKIPKLKVSDKDAQDFANFLKTQEKLFRKVHLALLRNEQATKREVEKHLYYELRRAGKDDTIIVFLSGHGADDPNMPGEFFFLTHDADPQILAASAVHMNRQWFLNKLDSKRVVLIADACHAGGFSTEGAKSLPPSLQNFMTQFRESEGRVFITSSRADEVSREKPDLGNSLFTYYLIEGLKGQAADKDGIVTIKGLYDFVYRNTKDAANGFQHPQMEGRVVGMFPLALAQNVASSGTMSPQPARESERRFKREKPLEAPNLTRVGSPSDERTEFGRYLALAQKGDPQAQAVVGAMCEQGRGVPQDEEQAMKWFELAARQGNGFAERRVTALRYRFLERTVPSRLSDETAPTADRQIWIVIKDSSGRCSTALGGTTTSGTIAGPFATQAEAETAKREMCPPIRDEK